MASFENTIDPYSTLDSKYAGGNRFILDDLNCNGNESSLFDCDHKGIFVEDCSSGEGVYLECSNTTGIFINDTVKPT